jgi:hypothetical protein
MSQLYQMQVTYAPVEDRMLFRVNTKERQEFRFWMTRRYVALLWKTVLGYLRARPQPENPVVAAAPEPIKDALIAKEHQEQVAKSDFKTQYQESSYLPLGESPLLLFGVGIKDGPQGQTLLCMHPQNAEGIEISLNDQITHSLCRLIADATKKADWSLDLDFKQASQFLPDQGPGLN